MNTKQLRQKILDLAIRGKLVPQDPSDEPASVLLARVKAEKERLIAEGKIKRSKKKATTADKPHYPFEIPSTWVWTRLNEITALIEDCPHSTAKDEGSGYPLIRTPNVGVGRLLLDGVHRVSKDVYDMRNARAIPQEGDIIYAREAPAGNAATIRKGEIVCLGQRTVLIRPLKGFVYSLLLTYFINAPFSRGALISKAVGSTAAHVNMEVIRPFLIPLPPLQEQIRIVEEVERIFTIINSIETEQIDLVGTISMMKRQVLELAISGKLVAQDPADEPAVDLLKRVNPNAVVSADTSHYQHLPQGWCACGLEDIVDYEQPQRYIVESTSYNDTYKTPVLTAGKSFIIGYTNETAGIFNNLPVIIFDDFTTDSKYVDFPFKVKSSAMKILHVKNGVNVKYVYYFMSITRLVGKTHKRYWISEYSKLNIPLPPYNEQCRIVEAIENINRRIDDIAEAL